MTFRAVRVLQTVDLIAAEDTRHTGKLLQHFQITTPQISYHEHNRSSRIASLLKRLQTGKTIALVTDAGMPGISDPGFELVLACVEAGVSVVPIPGVTAAITALCAAGVPSDRFVFEGFLPTKSKVRSERLNALVGEPRTLILYEAPHRLPQTLNDLATAFGAQRTIILARELTKLHEEFWRGSLEEAVALYGDRQPKGEFTLVIAGASPQTQTPSQAQLKAELQQLIGQGMTRSQASRQLAALTNLPRRQIYQLALETES